MPNSLLAVAEGHHVALHELAVDAERQRQGRQLVEGGAGLALGLVVVALPNNSMLSRSA
jgi:hypothetical protein